MAYGTFGDVLRAAREESGMDLATAGRRLRIRPDILQAIENCDFNSMPPKGYARNMINSYAKLVGLNPTEVVRLYLDDVYSNQSREAMRASQEANSQFDMGSSNRRVQVQRDRDMYAHQRAENNGRAMRGSTRSTSRVNVGRENDPFEGFTRGTSQNNLGFKPTPTIGNMYDDGMGSRDRSRRVGGRDVYYQQGSPRSGVSDRGVGNAPRDERRTPRGNRDIYAGSSNGSNFGNGLGGFAPRSFSSRRNPSMNSIYSGNGRGGIVAAARSKLPLIIGGVVILLLLLLLVVNLVNCGGSNKKEEVTTAPVSGLTDPGDAANNKAAVTMPTPPTAATVAYTVGKDQEVYCEIYLNDSATPELAEVLTGGAKGSYQVDNKLTFVTTNPAAVTLTVDGSKVELTDPNGSGVYKYDVDFNVILEQWNKDHAAEIAAAAQAQKEQEAADANAGNSTSSSSGTSSSGSSNSNSSSN